MTRVNNKGEWTTACTVVSQEEYDVGPFDFGSDEDGTLDAVIASLNKIRESIPEDYRTFARCEVSSVGGYEGEHHANIEVSYSRPATNDEILDTQLHQRHAQERMRADEMETLAMLKAKYETPKAR